MAADGFGLKKKTSRLNQLFKGKPKRVQPPLITSFLQYLISPSLKYCNMMLQIERKEVQTPLVILQKITIFCCSAATSKLVNKYLYKNNYRYRNKRLMLVSL